MSVQVFSLERLVPTTCFSVIFLYIFRLFQLLTICKQFICALLFKAFLE